MNGKREFLDFMVENKALTFGEFTLKSGRKSPYFMNAGAMFQDGETMMKLGKFYADLIGENNNFNVLFGPAYKGIPLASVTAAELARKGKKYYVSYDRKERKDHGEQGVIMGYVPKDGDKIAIVEDVITAGTSVRNTLDLIESQKIKADVIALYIAVDRMEKGTSDMSVVEEIKHNHGINVYSIVTVADIIEYLENKLENKSNTEHAEKIRNYLKEYGAAK